MAFVWISEQTAIIFLYSIKWLVFMTEIKCLYCEVWTGSLYTDLVNTSYLNKFYVLQSIYILSFHSK